MDEKSGYQTIKTSLKSVVKDNIVQQKLSDVAILTSKIRRHTLQFIKLYVLHCYDTEATLPTIDKKFVNACMKTMCERTGTRGKPPNAETVALKEHLHTFFIEHYQYFMSEPLSYLHLNTVLDYMAVEVVNAVQKKTEKIADIRNSDMSKEDKKRKKFVPCVAFYRI